MELQKVEKEQEEQKVYVSNGIVVVDKEEKEKLRHRILRHNAHKVDVFGIRSWFRDLWDWFENPENIELISGILTVAGSVLGIIGIALTPASVGGSMAIALVGGVLVIIGANLDLVQKVSKYEAFQVQAGLIVVPPQADMLRNLEKFQKEQQSRLEEQIYVLSVQARFETMNRLRDELAELRNQANAQWHKYTEDVDERERIVVKYREDRAKVLKGAFTPKFERMLAELELKREQEEVTKEWADLFWRKLKEGAGSGVSQGPSSQIHAANMACWDTELVKLAKRAEQASLQLNSNGGTTIIVRP